MTITEAMHSRHAVRSYVLRPLKEETAAALRTEIDRCNRESGLHIRLITGEPEAFSGFRARRAGFSGVSNYLVLAGAQPGFGGARRVLRSATGALRADAGAEHLLGGGQLPPGKVPRGAGRNAGLRHRRGLRRHSGTSPRQPVGGLCVPHRPAHSRVVPAGRGGGAAGAHRPKPPEFSTDAAGERGEPAHRRPLRGNQPGHFEMPV
jgi:hypothetical protein